MTRESAKEWKIIDTSSGITYSLEKLIDKIYDDFESKICENCSKWEQENGSQKANNKGMCNSYRDADEYYAIGITSGTHGCNEFERKKDV